MKQTKTWLPAFAGLTMLMAALPATAEWLKVGTTGMAVHYVDPATVRRDGNLRQVWAMQDMVEHDGIGAMSIRSLQEYDCAQLRFRYVSIAAYSGSMGGGRLVTSYAMRDRWSSRATAVGKMVCRE